LYQRIGAGEQGVRVARRQGKWLIAAKGVLTLKDLRVKNWGWHEPHEFSLFIAKGRRKIRNEYDTYSEMER
jgi:hypothetical protein